ncbi:hypothetical protein Tco_0365917 [Tanacetum coccineum]
MSEFGRFDGHSYTACVHSIMRIGSNFAWKHAWPRGAAVTTPTGTLFLSRCTLTYMPLEDEILQAEEQPLPAAASPLQIPTRICS